VYILYSITHAHTLYEQKKQNYMKKVTVLTVYNKRIL